MMTSLFEVRNSLNVPVVTVKSEITVWGRLFHTAADAWQSMLREVKNCKTVL